MRSTRFFFHPTAPPTGSSVKIRAFTEWKNTGVSEIIGGVRYGIEEMTCERSFISELFQKAELPDYAESCGREMIRQKRGNSSIMAIINMTPDSFYAGSRKSNRDDILKTIDTNPEYIDIGGESTRPGSAEVTPEEEIRRLSGNVEFIRDNYKGKLSLDTRHIETAKKFSDNVDIINDVSGLSDTALAVLSEEHGREYVLMHTVGTPQTMENHTHYSNLFGEMSMFYFQKLKILSELGLKPDRIILDPGLGFAKDSNSNLEIMKNPWVLNFGFRRLFGHSRKRFLGSVSGSSVDKRLPETLAGTISLYMNGVEIIRVHDAEENMSAIKSFSLFGGFSTF